MRKLYHLDSANLILSKIKENITCIVNIPNYKDLTFVAAAFHCAGILCYSYDRRNGIFFGNIGIERYDRSEHTWWNQNQEDAGPLRDTQMEVWIHTRIMENTSIYMAIYGQKH